MLRSPSPPATAPSDDSSDDGMSARQVRHELVHDPTQMLPPDTLMALAQLSNAGAAIQQNQSIVINDEDTVKCLWGDCGLIFTHLPTLIDHIHNDHIGVHKSNYTCEWQTCSRRSLAQTSRFALISHIRSHTGEKPFTCTLPECDKSFTRSDALAKHMRIQHGTAPVGTGRLQAKKKRKREDEDGHFVTSLPHESDEARAFKLEQGSSGGFGSPATDGSRSPGSRIQLLPPSQNGTRPPVPNGNGNGHPHSPHSDDDMEGRLPPIPSRLQLHASQFPGRTPSQVAYLIEKAKYRYAMEQHEGLLEDLRTVTSELKKEREEKEALLDKVLQRSFGEDAGLLMGGVEVNDGNPEM